jgi:hypothetical protein
MPLVHTGCSTSRISCRSGIKAHFVHDFDGLLDFYDYLHWGAIFPNPFDDLEQNAPVIPVARHCQASLLINTRWVAMSKILQNPDLHEFP